jgi:hypothetical protein
MACPLEVGKDDAPYPDVLEIWRPWAPDVRGKAMSSTSDTMSPTCTHLDRDADRLAFVIGAPDAA